MTTMIPAAKLERLLDRFPAIEGEMASGASGPAFVKLSQRTCRTRAGDRGGARLSHARRSSSKTPTR